MITKSKKAPGTVFYVKYDDAGKRVIEDMKKHLNRGEYRMRTAPDWHRRQADGTEACSRRLPLEFATYVAVYLDRKTTAKVTWSSVWSDIKKLLGWS